MTHACLCRVQVYTRTYFSLLGYIFLQYWHTRLNGSQYTGPLHLISIERRRDSRAAERGLEAGDVEQLNIKHQRNSFQLEKTANPCVLRIDGRYGTATNLDNKKIQLVPPAIRPVFTASTRAPYHATRRRRRTQYSSAVSYCMVRAVSCFLRARPRL